MNQLPKSEFDALYGKLEKMVWEDTLDLQPFCTMGHPYNEDGDDQLDDLQINEVTEDEIKGSFTVSFNERTPTGCRDINDDMQTTAYFDFIADRATLDITTIPIRERRCLDRNNPEF